MDKTRFAAMNCSLGRTMSVVGDAWSMLILRDVWLAVNRFDDLVRDLGISRNLLTRRLGDLVSARLIVARKYSDRPLRHEYVLTAQGLELVPAVLSLLAWGDKWLSGAGKEPLLVRHATCGKIAHATPCCSECGEPMRAIDLQALPGPGGAQGPGTVVLAERLAPLRPKRASGN